MFRCAFAFMAPALAHHSLVRVARAADAPADRPIRALLVIGGGSHDYPKQKDILVEGISARANVVFQMAFDPAGVNNHANPVYDDPDWAKGFDVVVHDESVGQVKDLKLVERILKPHREGLPAVVLHSGMHAYRTEGWPKAITPWFEFTGLQTTGHGPQFPISIHFLDTKDPITEGFSDWTTMKEELYNNAAGKLLDTAHPLARGKQTVKDKTQDNSSCGRTCTTARRGSSPRRSGTITKRSKIPAISTSSPAGCCGRSTSSTRPISSRRRRRRHSVAAASSRSLTTAMPFPASALWHGLLSMPFPATAGLRCAASRGIGHHRMETFRSGSPWTAVRG